MATPLRKSGLPSTDYYAPDFRVEIEGEALDPESHGDIIEVKVVMDMDNMTSFDLPINNWDDKRIAFKYRDSDTFNIGNRVHVLMGYAGKLLSMVTGEIATLSPHFPETGATTLTVGGLDGMFKLRDRKPAEGEVTKYANMADWQIAEFIAQRKHEYEEDVDLVHLAAELVVDAVVQPEDLRAELSQRLALAATRVRADAVKRHGVPPV